MLLGFLKEDLYHIPDIIKTYKESLKMIEDFERVLRFYAFEAEYGNLELNHKINISKDRGKMAREILEDKGIYQ